MKYKQLIQLFHQRPFFETPDLLMLANEKESVILPQLSRWTKEKRLLQLRRGKYLLPEMFRQQEPHPFFIANYLVRPSYISLFTALQYYQMIPEHTHLIQSVTTQQGAKLETELGFMRYYSCQVFRFSGYQSLQSGNGIQESFYIAEPEKALIDICYYLPGEWTESRWVSLRLQNISRLNSERLSAYTETMNSPKIRRGIQHLQNILPELR
jgi:predicted transcriptional regulator of viral defense system